MLDVLSIFERLSKNTTLAQLEVSENLKFVPASIQEAFIDKDSRVLRNSCAMNQTFSDGVMSFSDGVAVFNIV